ncbi:MAG: hypothetical protein IK096_06250, partial [Lachnospiraceae bacterium]|nr:hypothetical protein [Lachnospiraceae bacterium]
MKKEQTAESTGAETAAVAETTDTTGRSKRPVILGCMGTAALILLVAVGAVHARAEKVAAAKKAADIPIPVEVAIPQITTTGNTEETDPEEEEQAVEEQAPAEPATAAVTTAEPEPAEADADGKVTEDTEVPATEVMGSAEPEPTSELSPEAGAEEAPGTAPLSEEEGDEEKGCIGD